MTVRVYRDYSVNVGEGNVGEGSVGEGSVVQQSVPARGETLTTSREGAKEHAKPDGLADWLPRFLGHLHLERGLSPHTVDAYERDGVVCARALLELPLIERLFFCSQSLPLLPHPLVRDHWTSTRISQAQRADGCIGCNCPTKANPDPNRCHTVLALRFMDERYPDLDVEYP